MCIFVAVAMLLLVFYFSSEIINYTLIETIDTVSVELGSSWDLLPILWPAMAFMFLAGALFVLMLIKFIPKAKKSGD